MLRSTPLLFRRATKKTTEASGVASTRKAGEERSNLEKGYFEALLKVRTHTHTEQIMWCCALVD